MENLYLSIKTEPRIIENRAPQTADIDLFANSTSTPSSSGTADIILKQLVGMGFNREVCEMAVAEGLVNGNQSLEQATRYCLDYKDSNLNHPHVPSPKKTIISEPASPYMIPPKSILKNASSFQSTNYKKAPLPSPVSPDWFGNAAISITSTFNKIRKISNEPSPKTIHQKKLVKMKSDSSNDEDGLALAPTQEKDSKSIDSLNKSQRFVRFKYPNQTVEFSQAESDFDEMAKEFDASMTKNGTAIIIEKTEEDEATEFLSDALGKSVASALAAAASESRKNRGPQIILTANIIQPLNTAREIFNAYLGTCDRLNEAPLTLILDQFNQVFDDNRADLPLNKLDLSKIPLSNPVNLEMVSDLIKYSSKYLSSLNLEKTDLDDSSLMEILQNIVSFECPLSWLSLSNNNKIGLMGIKYISVFVKKSCFLKCLDLSGLIFDKNSMNFLAHAITIEKTNNEVASEFQRVWLSTLKLRNVKLDKYMLDILARGIVSSNVCNLALRNCQINYECGESVARLLKSMNKPNPIEYLDLGSNDLKQGVSSLFNVLSGNKTLRNLILSENKIDSNDLSEFITSISHNTTLERLCLSKNPLTNRGTSGFYDLKETLTTNTALKSLNLSKTNLNTEAAIILAEGLPFFKGINAIDMTLNPLDAAGLLAISVSLKLNQSVSKLELLPFLAPAPVFNLDAIFSPIITSLFNYSPVQPEKLSQKQEEEKQEELGKYLNDIEIYCRRNKEIIKRQDIVGEEGSETSLSDSHTSLTIPIEADYTDLFKFLEECKNVAELFLELQESNSDIAQHLRTEIMKRREQLHTIINSNSIHDETVLDLLFLRNDLLDSVLIRFNLRVAEVDVKEMEKPKLMFKPDLFPKKRILKSPAIETSRDELDKALDVKTPSKLLDSESDLLEKLDLDDNDNSLNSEDLLNLDMDPDLQMQEVDDFLDSL